MGDGRSPKKRKRRSGKKSLFSLKKFWTKKRARAAKAAGLVLGIFVAGVVAGGYLTRAGHVQTSKAYDSFVEAPPDKPRKAAPVFPRAREHTDREDKRLLAPPVKTPAPSVVKPTPARPISQPAGRRETSSGKPVIADGDSDYPSTGQGPGAMLASLPPLTDGRPSLAKVAIIIDDIGQSMEAVEKLLAIGPPIALAILPHQPHSRQAAVMAREKGQVVMLHLPMEPKSRGNNPGPGALRSAHDAAQLQELFTDDLSWIPGAMGVNNHMGSLLTERAESMATVMEELRSRGLFFVDSRTSPGSVAYQTARRMGVQAAKRDVFLDNERDVRKIINALEDLAAQARRNGSAVGIGHPYPETIQALELFVPRMGSMGVRLTPITKLLKGGQETGIHAKKPDAACAGSSC